MFLMIESRIAMCMCGCRVRGVWEPNPRDRLHRHATALRPAAAAGWLDSFHGSPLLPHKHKALGGLLKPFGWETGMCGPRGQLALMAEQPGPVAPPSRAGLRGVGSPLPDSSQ